MTKLTETTVNKLAKDNGLDYEVAMYQEKNPFTGEDIPYFGTYRTDNKHVFKTGLTGKYTIIQPKDALKTLIEFAQVADDQVEVKKIGEWNQGQEIFATMKINGDIKVGGARSKDTVEQNVSLYLRHDGHASCKFAVHAFRAFCKNQLKAIFMTKVIAQLLQIRHTASANKRLQQLAIQYKIIDGAFKQTAELYNTMADTKITKKQVEDVLEELHPTNSNSKSINTMNAKTQEILASIFKDADGGKIKADTAWNMYNTVTNYNTHHNDKYNNPERSLLVGTGAKSNQEALKVVQKYTDIEPALFQYDVNRILSQVDVTKTENQADTDKILSMVNA